MKSSDQLLRELDLLIEADFQKAKAELEQLKNSPSVFTIFTLEENNVDETFNQINSIFAIDLFIQNVLPFKSRILNRDESFFINKYQYIFMS